MCVVKIQFFFLMAFGSFFWWFVILLRMYFYDVNVKRSLGFTLFWRLVGKSKKSASCRSLQLSSWAILLVPCCTCLYFVRGASVLPRSGRAKTASWTGAGGGELGWSARQGPADVFNKQKSIQILLYAKSDRWPLYSKKIVWMEKSEKWIVRYHVEVWEWVDKNKK